MSCVGHDQYFFSICLNFLLTVCNTNVLKLSKGDKMTREEKIYSMKETCKETGLTYDALKFYCNEGLVPNVKRDKNNYRIFDDNDISWIKSLSCLKNCGMSIVEMKEYLDLCLKGEVSIPERKLVLDAKLHELEHKKQEIQDSVDYIHWKQSFYDDVLSGKKEYFSYLIKTKKD